jgi:hypothetical protein
VQQKTAAFRPEVFYVNIPKSVKGVLVAVFDSLPLEAYTQRLWLSFMKTRFFLSTMALVFASGVLALSLMTARDASATNNASPERKQLYFGKEILPDNVLYPVLMTVDRVELETSSADERIFMQIEYANRRLGYAEDLLEVKKENLALSTLSKAENYLYNATQEAQQVNAPSSVKQRLVKAYAYHIEKIESLSDQFTDSNRSQIDKILQADQDTLQSLE